MAIEIDCNFYLIHSDLQLNFHKMNGTEILAIIEKPAIYAEFLEAVAFFCLQAISLMVLFDE